MILFKTSFKNKAHRLLTIMIASLIIFVFIIITTKKSSFADIVIQSRINNGPWLKEPAISPLKGDSIFLKVDRIPNADIKWFQIIPDLSKIYKNANFPWDDNPYKWTGFAKIKYVRKELRQARGKWTIKPRFQNNILLSEYYHNNVGSFWLQAEILKEGSIFTSPGIEETDHRGLSPKVFRISIRDGKGFLGYLTSFFNVPGLFGSVTYQSYNYIGVDCADVLIAAYARWKNQAITKNYNVAMLVNDLSQMIEFEIQDGTPLKTIHWRRDIKRGDFIAVKSHSNGQYFHIGALYGDANQNGILDKNDVVIHAGPLPLQYSNLGEGAFNGHIVILRSS